MSDETKSSQEMRSSALFSRPSPPLSQPAPRRRPISLILLGGAIVIAGSMLGLSSVFQTDDNITIDVSSLKATPTGSLEMTGARYAGQTSTGGYFSITAERAVEDDRKKGIMHLFKPDGTLESDDNRITHLTSSEGFYKADTDIIELFGSVRVYRNVLNMTLLTERMEANIATGTMQAPTPVELTTVDMRLTSESMQAFNHGDRIIFSGTTRAVFNTGSQP